MFSIIDEFSETDLVYSVLKQIVSHDMIFKDIMLIALPLLLETYLSLCQIYMIKRFGGNG